ncbi:Peptidoglycan-associated lipoprotein [Paraburkholderia nemoris]|uniref:OmpA family protein n=1 Tax=Paraburkholderia nemoris TaxID=2793076 RepID=UPI00190D30C6|nr:MULTISPECIES: OmpA family protein [Paraburkholderia]MBK3786919.1 OmpA family protein [Paraburkholderia aspalathi]CAE6859068.1 Peptidoglycan-associated lipoprotein [Paraburkholderia nemoris]
MKLKHLATLTIAVTLASMLGACASPLDRNAEEAKNRSVGLAVSPVDNGIEVTLPESVLFAFDESRLRGDTAAVIARAAVLVNRSTKPVQVNGYTDNTGTREHNQRLSEERADAVARALIGRGVAPGRIRTKGLASDHPVASNDTDSGRARNRRTEIVVVGESVETLMGPQ